MRPPPKAGFEHPSPPRTFSTLTIFAYCEAGWGYRFAVCEGMHSATLRSATQPQVFRRGDSSHRMLPAPPLPHPPPATPRRSPPLPYDPKQNKNKMYGRHHENNTTTPNRGQNRPTIPNPCSLPPPTYPSPHPSPHHLHAPVQQDAETRHVDADGHGCEWRVLHHRRLRGVRREEHGPGLGDGDPTVHVQLGC